MSWPRTDQSADDTNRQAKETIESSEANCGNSLGIKKKPKRRRVNASTMSSTSANQLLANSKSATTSKTNSSLNVNSRSGGMKAQSHGKKKSSVMWDTDFDGAWEMGRDLIREFVTKQNNRNRSISESDVETFVQVKSSGINSNNKKKHMPNVKESVNVPNYESGRDIVDEKRYEDGAGVVVNAEENLMRIAAAATSALFGKNSDMATNMAAYNLNIPDSGTFSSASTVTDSSLLLANNEKIVTRSEGYATPDTMASWNEIDGNYVTAPRRLYEREVSNESINCAGIANNGDCEFSSNANSDCVDSGCDETNHLAAFEAKFDQSVEALWNDSKNDEQNPFTGNSANAGNQPTQSFWFNYYRHHYDNPDNQVNVEKQPIQVSTHSMASLPADYLNNANNQNVYGATQPNSLNSNYLSNNSASVSNAGGMSLINSIWTDNANNNEDDVSFYANAKLWEKAKTVEQQPNVSYEKNSFFYQLQL